MHAASILNSGVLALGVVALALSGEARAQEADLPWGVVETAHYRVAWPQPGEAWALYTAARLEAVRSRVVAEVGHAPDRVVDVVLLDPWRQSNGFAIPLGPHPRMGVFPTAPGADSVLGWTRDWAEDLVVHEDAHLVHLLRPSRSPLWNASVGLLGLGPVAARSPAWVIEGYATLVEGRLTGTGRPHGDLRAAWLRVLASQGRLPSYRGLSGDGSFLGRSHPYLLGSAWLEWLEARRCGGRPGERPPGECRALPDLWARMSARRDRGFRAAFTGVYGDEPAALYGRFRAELSAAALEVEAARPVDDSLWLDLAGGTSGPQVSPDGARILAVRREGERSRLVVWSTEDQPDAAEEWLRPHRRALERDPEDVLPVLPESFPREPVATRAAAFRPAAEARWLPDGRILYSTWEPDARGDLRPDLYTWDPDSGRDRRVTRGAEVSDPDPSPDGTWAVAHRQAWGRHALLRVDLATGAVEALVQAEVPVVLDHPRLSPDGRHLSWLRHDGTWRVVVRDLRSGEERVLPTPAGALVATPEWAPDGQALWVTLGDGGFVEVARLGLDGSLAVLTRSRGAATAPAPSPDGRWVYHLGLDADGLDLHRIAAAEAVWEGLGAVASRPPAVAPEHPAPPGELPAVAVGPGRRYGLGRLEWSPLVGGAARVGGGTAELGLRLGDLVGRHELLVLGGWGEGGGVTGGALRWAWRGPGLGPGGQLSVEPFLLDEGLRGRGYVGGGEVGVGAQRQRARWPWQWRVGAWAEQALEGEGAQALYAELGAEPWTGERGWAGAEVDLYGAGELRAGAVQPRAEARLGLGLGYEAVGLWARAEAGHAPGGWRLGGLDSSLLPAAWSRARVPVPVLAPDSLGGSWHGSVEGALDLGGVELLVQTRRAHDALAEPAAAPGVTWLGLRTRSSAPALGLARIPALDAEAGLACVLERPGAGWSPAPCRALDDYAAWLAARWGW